MKNKILKVPSYYHHISKVNIENPAFYFKNTDPREKEYIDLLLLNQGWTTYSLEEKINEINPKKLFLFKSGFSINGKIKKYPKGYDIGLLSKQNRFAYKNDTIKLSLIKKDKPLIKPGKLNLYKPKRKKNNFNFITKKYKQNLIKDENTEFLVKNRSYYNTIQVPKLEHLDEIVLNPVHSKKKKNQFELNREMAHNRNIIGSSFYKGSKVSKEMEVRFESVISYLSSLGYVQESNPKFISLRTGAVTLFDPVKNAGC